MNVREQLQTSFADNLARHERLLWRLADIPEVAIPRFSVPGDTQPTGALVPADAQEALFGVYAKDVGACTVGRACAVTPMRLCVAGNHLAGDCTTLRDVVASGDDHVRTWALFATWWIQFRLDSGWWGLEIGYPLPLSRPDCDDATVGRLTWGGRRIICAVFRSSPPEHEGGPMVDVIAPRILPIDDRVPAVLRGLVRDIGAISRRVGCDGNPGGAAR